VARGRSLASFFLRGSGPSFLLSVGKLRRDWLYRTVLRACRIVRTVPGGSIFPVSTRSLLVGWRQRLGGIHSRSFVNESW
jgi:hypothetical protein